MTKAISDFIYKKGTGNSQHPRFLQPQAGHTRGMWSSPVLTPHVHQQPPTSTKDQNTISQVSSFNFVPIFQISGLTERFRALRKRVW